MVGATQRGFLLKLLVFWVAFQPLIVADDTHSSVSKPAASSKTSICDALAHSEDYANGKPVELHARYNATWEGAWLSDSECEGVGQLVVPPSPNIEKSYAVVLRRVAKQYKLTHAVRDKGWLDFDSAAQRLYTGLVVVPPDPATAPAYDYVTADFSGILVTKQSFHVKNGFGNGWGHLRMARFLLVLRSVSNVVPHPCACS
jgi:hypothetical protein